MPTDQEARVRLGRLLAARRVELNPRYRNRRTFAADTGMGWRTLYDIEMARRDNFTSGTLRAFEGAYRLRPGSLDRFDGELEPLPADAPRIAAVPDPAVPREPREGDADEVIEALIAGSEVLQLLWRYPDPKGPVGKLLAREKRLALMRAWISNDPRGVLDDEDRHRDTGA